MKIAQPEIMLALAVRCISVNFPHILAVVDVLYKNFLAGVSRPSGEEFRSSALDRRRISSEVDRYPGHLWFNYKLLPVLRASSASRELICLRILRGASFTELSGCDPVR
jgi:hypothetical protein